MAEHPHSYNSHLPTQSSPHELARVGLETAVPPPGFLQFIPSFYLLEAGVKSSYEFLVEIVDPCMKHANWFRGRRDPSQTPPELLGNGEIKVPDQLFPSALLAQYGTESDQEFWDQQVTPCIFAPRAPYLKFRPLSGLAEQYSPRYKKYIPFWAGPEFPRWRRNFELLSVEFFTQRELKTFTRDCEPITEEAYNQEWRKFTAWDIFEALNKGHFTIFPPITTPSKLSCQAQKRLNIEREKQGLEAPFKWIPTDAKGNPIPETYDKAQPFNDTIEAPPAEFS